LKEAFQQSHYEPVTMQPKMVSLFRGLCREAGLLKDEPKKGCAPGAEVLPSHLPAAQESIALVKGERDPRKETALSPLSIDEPAPIEGDAKVQELGVVLRRLLELPTNPWWTDAELPWWRRALFLTTEQMFQTLQQQREGKNVGP
jgi:hypothetical protein